MPIVASNRVAPWIGIGVSGRWDSSAEALEASRLDFTVRQEDLFWQLDDDGVVYNERAPMFANVRNTDNKLLGCVTQQYRVIQNSSAFSLIDPFLTNGKITNAGMTEDGLCFMVAEINGGKKIGGEDYKIYLMVTNSFNTKYPCQVIMTPVRIICQNMYRKLVPDRILLAKHTTTVHERLNRIASGSIVDKKVLMFTDIIEQAQARRVTLSQMKDLVAMLFPYPKEKGPREQTYVAKADQARQQFFDDYYDAKDNICHHDTAFGFINAYFDYLSHRPAARDTGVAWADRRLSGLVSGIDIENSVIRAALK